MHRSCSVTVLEEGPFRELLQKDHNGWGCAGGFRSACRRADDPVESAGLPVARSEAARVAGNRSLLFRDHPNQWRSSDMTSLGCHAFGTRAGIRTAHRQSSGLRPRRPSAPVGPSRWPSAPLLPSPGSSAPPGPQLPGRRAAGRRPARLRGVLPGRRTKRRVERCAAPAEHGHHPDAHPYPDAAPSPTPTPTKIDVPSTGTGTFVTAHASGAKVGHGSHLLRYVVEVETGLDISPTQAANEIADILAAPRGWTHNGVSSFQLVGAGSPTTSR